MIETGIQFGEIHSFFDLNLILSKVDIPPAQPKETYVDIPGGEGSLDLTESVGKVTYSDRQCKFTFTMNPQGGLSDRDFEAKKTEVSNVLNGVRCQITIDKDADFYYLGRCQVNQYLSNKKMRQIVITARVYPYKFKQDITEIQYSISPTNPTEITLINGRKTVVPEITCESDNTTVLFLDKEISKTFNAGTHKFLDFMLKYGENAFIAVGSGTITFKYQEAEL